LIENSAWTNFKGAWLRFSFCNQLIPFSSVSTCSNNYPILHRHGSQKRIGVTAASLPGAATLRGCANIYCFLVACAAQSWSVTSIAAGVTRGLNTVA
jgi:hypothetical protein